MDSDFRWHLGFVLVLDDVAGFIQSLQDAATLGRQTPLEVLLRLGPEPVINLRLLARSVSAALVAHVDRELVGPAF